MKKYKQRYDFELVFLRHSESLARNGQQKINFVLNSANIFAAPYHTFQMDKTYIFSIPYRSKKIGKYSKSVNITS